MEEKKTKEAFEIKAYTKKELRLLYGIPYYSFRRWLKEIPETQSSSRKNWLTVAQVEAIIKTYGIPGQKRFSNIEY
jgi:hypothetical protein